MDDMFSHFDTISACDRQTDRASCDGIVLACAEHRAVKSVL